MFRAFRTGMTAAAAYPPRGEILYAIGDVHGRLDLLKTLLDVIQEDFHRSGFRQGRLIILGDMIDRGPNSRGVIEHLMTYRADGLDLIVLRGNHEDALSCFLNDALSVPTRWFVEHGRETLRSFGVDLLDADLIDPHRLKQKILASVPADVKTFLDGLQNSHVAGDFFFCHAGVDCRQSLRSQKKRSLVWGSSDRPSVRSFSSMVVHGHFVTERPEIRGSFVSIDTGAHQSNRLTAARMPGGAIAFLTAEVARSVCTGSAA